MDHTIEAMVNDKKKLANGTGKVSWLMARSPMVGR